VARGGTNGCLKRKVFLKNQKHQPNIVEITHMCIMHGVHTSNIKLQWQSHEDVNYMNFSSIQTSLCHIIILQLILWLNNVVALFMYLNIYYLDIEKTYYSYTYIFILVISIISTYMMLTHVLRLTIKS
jgi:hypothetical protein